jgi:hypothetical protein
MQRNRDVEGQKQAHCDSQNSITGSGTFPSASCKETQRHSNEHVQHVHTQLGVLGILGLLESLAGPTHSSTDPSGCPTCARSRR